MSKSAGIIIYIFTPLSYYVIRLYSTPNFLYILVAISMYNSR